MIVGCLGGITFAVFDGYVKTVKDMVQSVSAAFPRLRGGDPNTTRCMPLYSVFSPPMRG